MFAVFLATAILPVKAQAEVDVTAAETTAPRDNIAGLGVAFVPDYEGSNDYEAVPLLQFRYNFGQSRYIGLLGNTLRANLMPDETWHIGPLVKYRKERDDVDDDQVDRMEKVDAAFELGAFLTYNTENWILSLSGSQDVSDAHDGYVVEFGAGYRHFFQRRAMLIVFGKASYASEDYMDTYFGVSPTDAARSGLQRYEADSDLKDAALGALMQYNFNDRWGLLGVLQYTKLLGDAEDSPLVDDEGDDSQWLGGLLVNYRF